MKKKSAINGWLALIIIALLNITISGLINSQNSLLFGPLSEGVGISRTMLATLYSFVAVVNVISSLTFSKFFDWLGLKKMTVIGVSAALLNLILLYLAGNMPNMAVPLIGLAYILWGVANSWATVMSIGIIVNNWFGRAQSTLVSLVATLASVSATIASPFIANMITNHGWQYSIGVRAILVAVLVVLVIVFFKVKPSANEKMIWATAQPKEKKETEEKKELTGMTLAEAKRTRAFWLVVVMMFLQAVFLYTPASLLPLHAADSGYEEIGGLVNSLIYFTSTILNLTLGTLMDKFGVRLAEAAIVILQIVAMALLVLVPPTVAVLYVCAVLIGTSYALFKVPVYTITKELFGDKEFAKIQSLIYAAMLAGFIFGSPVYNAIFDSTGSYKTAFGINLVVSALVLVILIVATSKRSREVKKS